MSKPHVCITCKELPILAPGFAHRPVPDKEYRPAVPRPTDIAQHPRTPMCATHRRAWRKANKAKQADKRRTKKGLSPGKYEELHAFQGGTCAIPGCPATGKTRALAVDHDHEIARRDCGHDPDKEYCDNCVRGLLCYNHNYYLIGMFKNSLTAGLIYLASPPAKRMRDAA